MSYVNDLETDEIRSGFLVTSQRKKLWNAHIGLIKEFQRVCEKYKLNYFAHDGTLLGAARHQGFIPWDDDLDFVMPRNDYEKLKIVAPNEVRYPYKFEIWYEHDDPVDEFGKFPLNTPMVRIFDLRTTQLERENTNQFTQCAWIDIWVLIPFPPFDDLPDQKYLETKFRFVFELTLAARKSTLLENPKNKTKMNFILGWDFLQEVRKLPLRQSGKSLEDMMIALECPSKYVFDDWLRYAQGAKIYKREWWNETVYLPFENISLPCPKKYDEFLTVRYGDWKKEIFEKYHTKIFTADMNYQKYFELKDSPDDLTERKNSLRTNLNKDELRNGIIVPSNKKRVWKVQLDLIEYLKRLGLKFFALDQTLYSAIKYQGFDPKNDYVTLGMPRYDFEKLQTLEINFPYRFEKNRLSNDLTSMIDKPSMTNIPQGIFIEIVPVDYDLEIQHVRFENISIPVPKKFDELLDDFEYNPKMFDGDVTADISWEEYLRKITKIILWHKIELINLKR